MITQIMSRLGRWNNVTGQMMLPSKWYDVVSTRPGFIPGTTLYYFVGESRLEEFVFSDDDITLRAWEESHECCD